MRKSRQCYTYAACSIALEARCSQDALHLLWPWGPSYPICLSSGAGETVAGPEGRDGPVGAGSGLHVALATGGGKEAGPTDTCAVSGCAVPTRAATAHGEVLVSGKEIFLHVWPRIANCRAMTILQDHICGDVGDLKAHHLCLWWLYKALVPVQKQASQNEGINQDLL